jgi:hypothetical protein
MFARIDKVCVSKGDVMKCLRIAVVSAVLTFLSLSPARVMAQLYDPMELFPKPNLYILLDTSFTMQFPSATLGAGPVIGGVQNCSNASAGCHTMAGGAPPIGPLGAASRLEAGKLEIAKLVQHYQGRVNFGFADYYGSNCDPQTCAAQPNTNPAMLVVPNDVYGPIGPSVAPPAPPACVAGIGYNQPSAVQNCLVANVVQPTTLGVGGDGAMGGVGSFPEWLTLDGAQPHAHIPADWASAPSPPPPFFTDRCVVPGTGALPCDNDLPFLRSLGDRLIKGGAGWLATQPWGAALSNIPSNPAGAVCDQAPHGAGAQSWNTAGYYDLVDADGNNNGPGGAIGTIPAGYPIPYPPGGISGGAGYPVQISVWGNPPRCGPPGNPSGGPPPWYYAAGYTVPGGYGLPVACAGAVWAGCGLSPNNVGVNPATDFPYENDLGNIVYATGKCARGNPAPAGRAAVEDDYLVTVLGAIPPPIWWFEPGVYTPEDLSNPTWWNPWAATFQSFWNLLAIDIFTECLSDTNFYSNMPKDWALWGGCPLGSGLGIVTGSAPPIIAALLPNAPPFSGAGTCNVGTTAGPVGLNTTIFGQNVCQGLTNVFVSDTYAGQYGAWAGVQSCICNPNQPTCFWPTPPNLDHGWKSHQSVGVELANATWPGAGTIFPAPQQPYTKANLGEGNANTSGVCGLAPNNANVRESAVLFVTDGYMGNMLGPNPAADPTQVAPNFKSVSNAYAPAGLADPNGNVFVYAPSDDSVNVGGGAWRGDGTVPPTVGGGAPIDMLARMTGAVGAITPGVQAVGALAAKVYAGASPGLWLDPKFEALAQRNQEGDYTGAALALSENQDRVAQVVFEVPKNFKYWGHPMHMTWYGLDPNGKIFKEVCRTDFPVGGGSICNSANWKRHCGDYPLGAAWPNTDPWIGGRPSTWANGIGVLQINKPDNLGIIGDMGYMLGDANSQPLVVAGPREIPSGQSAPGFTNFESETGGVGYGQRDRIVYMESNGYVHGYWTGVYQGQFRNSGSIPKTLDNGQTASTWYDDSGPFGAQGVPCSETMRYEPIWVHTSPLRAYSIDSQQQLMNGQIVSREMWINGNGSIEQHFGTILVATQGRAGGGISMLDISNPGNNSVPGGVSRGKPIVLWESAAPMGLGTASAQPALYQLPPSGAANPALIMTDGLGGSGWLYAFNVAPPGGNTHGAPGAVLTSIQMGGQEFATGAQCVDSQGTGRVDACYMLSTSGQLWRVRLDTVSGTFLNSPGAPNYSPQLVYSAPGGYFSTPPVVFFGANNSINIAFGSGDPSNLTNAPGGGAFYILKDDGTGLPNPVTQTQTCLSGANYAAGNSSFAFPGNQRLLTPPVISKGVLAFTTFDPPAAPCAPGQSFLYALDFMTCLSTNQAGMGVAPGGAGIALGAGPATSPTILRNSETIQGATTFGSPDLRTATLGGGAGGASAMTVQTYGGRTRALKKMYWRPVASFN